MDLRGGTYGMSLLSRLVISVRPVFLLVSTPYVGTAVFLEWWRAICWCPAQLPPREALQKWPPGAGCYLQMTTRWCVVDYARCWKRIRDLRSVERHAQAEKRSSKPKSSQTGRNRDGYHHARTQR